ncbi:MAG: hypothetical protein ACOCYC_00885 [bacterium]
MVGGLARPAFLQGQHGERESSHGISRIRTKHRPGQGGRVFVTDRSSVLAGNECRRDRRDGLIKPYQSDVYNLRAIEELDIPAHREVPITSDFQAVPPNTHPGYQESPTRIRNHRVAAIQRDTSSGEVTEGRSIGGGAVHRAEQVGFPEAADVAVLAGTRRDHE